MQVHKVNHLRYDGSQVNHNLSNVALNACKTWPTYI